MMEENDYLLRNKKENDVGTYLALRTILEIT